MIEPTTTTASQGHGLMWYGARSHAVQLAELMGNTGRVVAVELHAARARRVRENAERLGLDCVRVVTADAADAAQLRSILRAHASTQGHQNHDGDAATAGDESGGPPLADCVVLDAPCSGTGTLRRNPEFRYRRGAPTRLTRLVEMQAELLDAAAELVAVGGTLTYAVCSPLACETTEAVRAFLARQPAFEVIPVDVPELLPYATDCDGLGGARTCLRTWTHKHPADSHFACKLTRRSISIGDDAATGHAHAATSERE